MGSLPIDDEQAPLYSVGQVAEMLGVQPAFLRRLERYGVIAPARSGGGQRRYSRAEIARVQAAMQLTEEGMSVTGAERVLSLQDEVDRLSQELRSAREDRQDQQGRQDGQDRRGRRSPRSRRGR